MQEKMQEMQENVTKSARDARKSGNNSRNKQGPKNWEILVRECNLN